MSGTRTNACTFQRRRSRAHSWLTGQFADTLKSAVEYRNNRSQNGDYRVNFIYLISGIALALSVLALTRLAIRPLIRSKSATQASASAAAPENRHHQAQTRRLTEALEHRRQSQNAPRHRTRDAENPHAPYIPVSTDSGWSSSSSDCGSSSGGGDCGGGGGE